MLNHQASTGSVTLNFSPVLIGVLAFKSSTNVPISFTTSVCPHVKPWEWLMRFP
jgi:hypothetical protein